MDRDEIGRRDWLVLLAGATAVSGALAANGTADDGRAYGEGPYGDAASEGNRMSDIAEYHGVTLPTPGGDVGTWGSENNSVHEQNLKDTARVGTYADRPADPGFEGALYRAYDRDQLYRFSNGSWSAADGGQAGTYDGAVLARYYLDDEERIATESFDTIQAAVDALPVQENEYSGATGTQPRTAGDVIISSKSGNNPYDGQVILDKKGTYRALGRWVELSHDVAGEPTVLIAQNDEANTPDDVYIQDLWVEHMGDDVAIKSNDDETHLQDINLERSGDVAIELTGQRNTAVGVENKGGAFKVTNDQGYFTHVTSHNEVIGYGKWPTGFVIDGDYNNFSNSHGWLANSPDFETTCIEMNGVANWFIGSCAWTKHKADEGKPTYGIQFGADAHRNTFAGNIQKCQTGVDFGSSQDNRVGAHLVENDTDVNWGTGSRNILNGRSVNSGNPASEGAWNGYAGRAHSLDVTVWDTSVSPAVAYIATPGGSWRSLNTTAA